MGDVHIDISNDDNPRFALYAGGVFELMIGSFSINMNAHQFQQLCDNLRPWIVDDSAPPAAAGSADEPHVFNCRRCPVSVESRWQPPDCPECGQPCALDTSAKPAAAQQPPPAAVSEELLAAASAVVARWDSPLWKDQPHTGELIQRLRNALAEQAPPAAVPEGYALVPVEPLIRARNTAMQWVLRGRIPECGKFGDIAQDLDWLLAAARKGE